MADTRPAARYRFGIFEVDSASGELRRSGIRVKLHAQPLQILLMLLDRPGEIVTREEICRELWPDGTFVDYDHGVNSALNRLREALGDKAGNPRYVETLARRGYRFVGQLEHSQPAVPEPAAPKPEPNRGILAAPEDLPRSSPSVVRILFILLQLMYAGFYIGALANLPEIDDLLSPLPFASQIFEAMIATAALLIPVRTFLLCAVLFRAPGFRAKFLKLWPFLLALDGLWALAPFLLLHHISEGLALACTTLLVYAPFAQRSLILMATEARAR